MTSVTTDHPDGQSRPRRVRTQAGRADRAFERLYERLGSRVLLVIYAYAAVLGLLTGLSADFVIGRYLGLSTADIWSIWIVWTPIQAVLGIAGVLSCRHQLRTILSWAGSRRTTARAAETWEALVHHQRFTLSGAAAMAISLPPSALDIVLRADKPWWGVFPVTVGALAGLATWATVTIFGADLIGRPMREDVARHLPETFELKKRGPSLRIKTLAPMAVLALYTAIFVGAYADLSANGLLRYSLTLGAASLIVALATLAFVVINRSALGPVHDLTAATQRVHHGDLVTRVPVVSADELGMLAHNFNLMLDGLRERDVLRDEVLRREDELRASRARIIVASDAERRRVERNIHDGAQQQLVGLAVKLRMLEERVGEDEELRAAVGEIGERLKSALHDLRELARGLHPPVLTTDGLPPALDQLASRAAVPVTVTAPEERFPEALESTAYFIACEALANVAKYAHASRAEISIERRNGRLLIEVSDDGVGGARTESGSGLMGLADRVAALDGTLTVDSPQGRGTRVMARLPIP